MSAPHLISIPVRQLALITVHFLSRDMRSRARGGCTSLASFLGGRSFVASLTLSLTQLKCKMALGKIPQGRHTGRRKGGGPCKGIGHTVVHTNEKKSLRFDTKSMPPKLDDSQVHIAYLLFRHTHNSTCVPHLGYLAHLILFGKGSTYSYIPFCHPASYRNAKHLLCKT